ncbi:unnamed protein product [Amoebophrya sp. A25]|nr:unnamed protein product [Amoebophrya sp. A25]|eukprot:GSA25T00027918001.1
MNAPGVVCVSCVSCVWSVHLHFQFILRSSSKKLQP